MSLDDNLEKISEFFKSSIIITELEEVMRFKPETLIGVDQISAEKLYDHGIETIQDLANQSENDPPDIKGLMPQLVLKWIKIGKVLEKAVSEELKAHKKLLMIGLDNGGKTSILSILQDKFSIIKSLLPTKGVKRERLDFFGFPIISWDLGGQIQYREKYYFNKPELFFTEVDIVLYVVDAQDPDRFNESAQYFDQVLEALEQLGEDPPVLIVLHKSDQDVRKTLEWQKNVSAIKNEFNPVLSKYNKENVEYFDTTIFQKETIMQMFSIALKKVSDTSAIIENILEEFTLKSESKASSLISQDGLIFGSYFKTNTDEMLVNNTALLLQTLSNFHDSIGLIRERVITLDFPLNEFTIRGEKLFDYSDLQIPVYLWVLTENPAHIKERIDFFKEQLLPLINLFL
jgi:GTPase SAR1 family protein